MNVPLGHSRLVALFLLVVLVIKALCLPGWKGRSGTPHTSPPLPQPRTWALSTEQVWSKCLMGSGEDMAHSHPSQLP